MNPTAITDRRRRHAINVLDDLAHVLDEYEGCFDPSTNTCLREAGRLLCGRLAQLRTIPRENTPRGWDEPPLFAS